MSVTPRKQRVALTNPRFVGSAKKKNIYIYIFGFVVSPICCERWRRRTSLRTNITFDLFTPRQQTAAASPSRVRRRALSPWRWKNHLCASFPSPLPHKRETLHGSSVTFCVIFSAATAGYSCQSQSVLFSHSLPNAVKMGTKRSNNKKRNGYTYIRYVWIGKIAYIHSIHPYTHIHIFIYIYTSSGTTYTIR